MSAKAVREMLRQRNLEELKTWWGFQTKAPGGPDCLEAAWRTEQPDVAAFLISHVMKRKVRAKGWTDAVAAVVGGLPEHFALADKRDADVTARGTHGTPLSIAVARRNLDAIRWILDKGVGFDWVHTRTSSSEVFRLLREYSEPSDASLRAAVSANELAFAREDLDAGIPWNESATSAMRSAEAVAIAREAGWDGSKPERIFRSWVGVPGWAHHFDLETNRARLTAFLDALCEAGVRCTQEDFAMALSRLYSHPHIEAMVRMGATLDGRITQGKDKGTPVEIALKHHGASVVRALLEAGAPAPAKIKPNAGWRDAEEKRELLSKAGVRAQSLTPTDLLALGDLRSQDLIAVLKGVDGVFGVHPGMTKDEVSALGLKHRMGKGPQLLRLKFSEGVVTKVSYELSGHSDYGTPLLALLIETYGKAKKVAGRWEWTLEHGTLEFTKANLSTGIVPIFGCELRYA
ncbi:MAG: hypothetical protein AAGE52_13200 [Myxococcota bacterium]